MTERVMAAGVMVEQRDATPQANVTASGVMIEQRDATPQVNVMLVGVMLELQEVPYSRPPIVTECAPEVDSTHRPVSAIAQDVVSILAPDVISAHGAIDPIAQNPVTVLAPQVDSQHLATDGILAGGSDVKAPNIDTSHTPVTGISQVVTTVSILRPSIARQMGISMAIYQPTIGPGTYVPKGRYLRSLDAAINGWSHVSAIDGGYISATGEVTENRGMIEDWIEYGLGRHVEVYADGGQIFEGFVNQLDVRYGPLTYNIGPLLDITNRCLVWYSPINYETDPPTVGASTPSTLAQDTTSQARYGIIENQLSTGECSDTDAEYYRDMFLAENAQPKTTKDIAFGQGEAAFGVTLTIVGYGAWLGKYTYDSSSILFTTSSAKILTILQAAPNVGMFNTAASYGIQTNATIAPVGEADQGKTAINIIETIRNLGDVNNNRWVFGIWENQRPRFEVKESAVTYRQRLSEPIQLIRDLSGSRIMPWQVKPGKWLYIEDFLPGRVSPSYDLRTDPRALYIEEVTYTYPFGLAIRGSGGDGKLSQWLARTGLSGM